MLIRGGVVGTRDAGRGEQSCEGVGNVTSNQSAVNLVMNQIRVACEGKERSKTKIERINRMEFENDMTEITVDHSIIRSFPGRCCWFTEY